MTEDKPDTTGEWTPSADANSTATNYRLIALLLWALAIAGELGLIFGVLHGQVMTNQMMAILIGGIVGIAVFAIAGNMLWKKANRLDPAHKADKVRFFFQNQLGAILTLIAFVPLIVLIFLDKDMSKNQKLIAGIIGVIVALLATASGIDFHPPSVEQYTAERNKVEGAVGSDHVFWGPYSEVFHVCDKVADLSHSKQIFDGTVAEAHKAGMDRLTLKVDQEAKQCGFQPSAEVAAN